MLRFWENEGWINKIDPYGWFQWYFRYSLGGRSKDEKRQINTFSLLRNDDVVLSVSIVSSCASNALSTVLKLFW